jgi:23S rRNA (pseudouridine1915-N3)-methyltransferase
MRISVIAVGRLRPPYQDDVEHYRKMLAGHVKVDLVEVREDEKVALRIPDRALTVLLSSDGRQLAPSSSAAGSRNVAATDATSAS